MSTTLEIQPFTCNASQALTTKKGRDRGTRYNFAGGQSAKDIRAALKAKGVKGSALDTQVNACLRGHATLSQQLAHAFIASESARGVVWEHADSLKRGATIKGILAPEKAAEPAPMTREEKEALVTKLLAELNAPEPTVLEA